MSRTDSNKLDLKVNKNKTKIMIDDRFNFLRMTGRLNEYELIDFNYSGFPITNNG